MYIQMYRVFGGGGVSHLPARAELGGDQDLRTPQHVARSGGSAQPRLSACWWGNDGCLLQPCLLCVLFLCANRQTEKGFDSSRYLGLVESNSICLHLIYSLPNVLPSVEEDS